MEKKRIFIVNQTDESHKYGVGKYISEIEQEVIRRKTGYSLVVITIGVPEIARIEKRSRENVTYFNIPKPFFQNSTTQSLSYQFSKAVFCILNDYFKIKETDIFHFNSNMQHFLIKEIKENTSAKAIYTIHVALWKVFYNNDHSRFVSNWNDAESESKQLRSIKAEVKNCELSDWVICLSDEMKRDIIEMYNIPEKKIKKVTNGISEIEEENHDETLIEVRKKEMGINNDDFVFLYVGRLNAQKGVMFLMDTIKKVIKGQQKKIKLIMVGEGSEKEILQKSSKGIEQNITFTGYLPQNEVKHYYKMANAIIFPSLNEQSSYVMLEAMKYKIPMLITDIEVFNHLKDEVSSMKINLKSDNEIDIGSFVEKINQIIENADLRKKIAENAHELFKRDFTSKKMFEMTYN